MCVVEPKLRPYQLNYSAFFANTLFLVACVFFPSNYKVSDNSFWWNTVVNYFPVVYWQVNLPADEVSLAETHLEAVLSGAGRLMFLSVTVETIPLDAVETPRPFARLHSQTALLRVDGEHWELRLAQRPWKHSQEIVTICLLKWFW